MVTVRGADGKIQRGVKGNQNALSPAKTGKDTQRPKYRSPMKKDAAVLAHFTEVLMQIQCKLGSLDRTVKSQAEKQVEIEHRIDRKRGAEING